MTPDGAVARPRTPPGGRALALLTWGLAFHSVFLIVLLGQFGLGVEQVRIVASWKEALAVGLVVWAAARAAAGRVEGLGVRASDLLAAALVVLALLHGAASLAGIGPANEPADAALGIRDLVFGFALYAVGRTTPLVADDRRILARFFAVGVVTSAIAVVEWLVVTPEQLVLLGVASYFNDFLGVTLFTRSNEFGLPGNYWTMVGGRLVQRAGSVYLSSQGFAVPFLLLVPAATAWLTVARRWTSPPFVAAYALLWAGLLLTLTRLTTVACVLQVLVLLALWRRPGSILAIVGAGVVVAAALLVSVPGLGGFVWETLTWQTSSSATHANDYYNGLTMLVERPLGAGVATADATAARLGRVPLTGDNLLLKYGVELGVAAMALLVAWLGAIVWSGVRAARDRPETPRGAFAAFVAAATLGITLNGMTAVVFNSPMLTYVFFWCAGTVVTVAATVERARD